MRIITCASYYGTGSSAITDLVSEYEPCQSMPDYEFRFVHDPYGISDLEFQLVQNHNRHNSGFALKKYGEMVNFLAGKKSFKKYEQFFHGQWKKLSYEYIDSLTDFAYPGYWHMDVINKGMFFYFRKRLINKILKNTIWRQQPERNLNEMPQEITLCSNPSEEVFLSTTKNYIHNLVKVLNHENKPDIIMDQMVPPSNLERYLRYFDDIQVFVVDRDPRDVYLLEKHVWKGRVVPINDVEVFCKWYRYTREHRKKDYYDKNKVTFIQFEDLVFNYDKTKKKIETQLGYTAANHIMAKQRFNPHDSMKNTRLWEKFPEENAMTIIEKNLGEYLYNI